MPEANERSGRDEVRLHKILFAAIAAVLLFDSLGFVHSRLLDDSVREKAEQFLDAKEVWSTLFALLVGLTAKSARIYEASVAFAFGGLVPLLWHAAARIAKIFVNTVVIGGTIFLAGFALVSFNESPRTSRPEPEAAPIPHAPEGAQEKRTPEKPVAPPSPNLPPTRPANPWLDPATAEAIREGHLAAARGDCERARLRIVFLSGLLPDHVSDNGTPEQKRLFEEIASLVLEHRRCVAIANALPIDPKGPSMKPAPAVPPKPAESKAPQLAALPPLAKIEQLPPATGGIDQIVAFARQASVRARQASAAAVEAQKQAQLAAQKGEEAQRRAQAVGHYASDGYSVGNFPNGERYEGDGLDDIKLGYGVYSWPNGQRCAGEWRDDKLNGYAGCSWQNGERHEGEFRDGHENGYGVHIWTDGGRFSGSFSNGQRDGYGINISGIRAIYEGEVHGGYLNGYGVLSLPDGRHYEGEFRDNVISGRGILTHKDGSTTIGLWQDGHLVQPMMR